MADVGSAGEGGNRLPGTFGEKFSYMAPVLGVTALATVVICFVLVWVVKGGLEDQITKLKTDTETKLTEHGDKIGKLTKVQDVLVTNVKQLTDTTTDLVKSRDELKKGLSETVQNLDKAQKSLVEVTGNVSKLADTQRDDNAARVTDITKVDNRLHYVEDKIKRLDALEADVTGLKNDTGHLKTDFGVLRGDLEKVRVKGEVTETELTDLTERTRMFQLRVLAARAKEAADAARQGDLKSLLQRLSDQ